MKFCEVLFEGKRGCGHRKEGGLYLVGGGTAVECDRLPYPLSICPVCGQGIKQSRGITEIDWCGLVGGDHDHCIDKFICPLCRPMKGEMMQLMWVGRKYYTPETFIKEAIKMGVSKRIAAVPQGIVLGETRVLLAHPDAAQIVTWIWKCDVCGDEFAIPELPIDDDLVRWKSEALDSVRVFLQDGGVLYDPVWYRTTEQLSRHAAKHRKKDEQFSMIEMEGKLTVPGIFYSFVPQRVEQVVTEEQAQDEDFIQKLRARGITPVVVKKKDSKEAKG